MFYVLLVLHNKLLLLLLLIYKIEPHLRQVAQLLECPRGPNNQEHAQRRADLLTSGLYSEWDNQAIDFTTLDFLGEPGILTETFNELMEDAKKAFLKACNKRDRDKHNKYKDVHWDDAVNFQVLVLSTGGLMNDAASAMINKLGNQIGRKRNEKGWIKKVRQRLNFLIKRRVQQALRELSRPIDNYYEDRRVHEEWDNDHQYLGGGVDDSDEE